MTEKTAVQDPMLLYASQIGWKYIDPATCRVARGGCGGLFMIDVLKEQLLRLNPGILDESRADEIIRQISLLKPTIEGNRDGLIWLRGQQSIFVPADKRERNVRLVDFDDIENNVFHVTDEWRHEGTIFPNRADVVFLVNGIPVAITEAKAAEKRDALAIAIDQLRRYHRETPELLTLPQLYTVTQLLDFFYGVTWNVTRKNIFDWKLESRQSVDYEAKVKSFFERSRLLRILNDYVVFLTTDDELVKVVLRQHQTRAVEKVIDRVQDGSKTRGLVWHTQGSGKTLTMITIAAKLMRDDATAEKPTILMLVDRNELEGQLFRNLSGYGLGSAKIAESKRDLQDILSSDYRGIVLTMIHKFDDIPADINDRKDIVVLIDEAHRTTSGDLGTYLMAALPNATYIGFTGTPIDRISKGQGTFKVFGLHDDKGYLDKYSIAESIEDGTTKELNYSLAPSDLIVDRDLLERKFLKLADAEGITDIDELNAVLDKAVELKEMMKSLDRVEKVAKYVAAHFKENVEPMGFKAFLVAVDREACALYKDALDRYLPPEYSQVVYSPAHNDALALKAHYMLADDEKELRKAFKKKSTLPKILIVTEKLLTGYDAPILYCMYLDKPMRDHVLLQAIARVNRPYEDDDGLTKPYGFILDFVGIFEKLEEALAFDSDIVGSVIKNIDVLKQHFKEMIENQAGSYLSLAQGWDDKEKERAIQFFEPKSTREAFFKFYRQLQNLYDILSPDVFLRPYMTDYQALAMLYALIRNAYADRTYVDKEFSAKTKELLRTTTVTSAIELPGAIYKLGPNELGALRKNTNVSDTSKLLNLRKLLTVTVQNESGSKPFLVSIGERADSLAQLYEDRQLTTQQVLAEFEQLAARYVDADSERQRLGLDQNSYGIYTVLVAVDDIENIEEIAKTLNATFQQYPDYLWNEQQLTRLRTELYKQLRTTVKPDKLIDVANALLRLRRV